MLAAIALLTPVLFVAIPAVAAVAPADALLDEGGDSDSNASDSSSGTSGSSSSSSSTSSGDVELGLDNTIELRRLDRPELFSLQPALYPSSRLHYGANEEVHERSTGLLLATSKLVIQRAALKLSTCKVTCMVHKDVTRLQAAGCIWLRHESSRQLPNASRSCIRLMFFIMLVVSSGGLPKDCGMILHGDSVWEEADRTAEAFIIVGACYTRRKDGSFLDTSSSCQCQC